MMVWADLADGFRQRIGQVGNIAAAMRLSLSGKVTASKHALSPLLPNTLKQGKWFVQSRYFFPCQHWNRRCEALLAEFKEEDLPNNTYYGDGSRLNLQF